MLAPLDTHAFTLYRVAVNESHNKKKRINELERFSQNLKECTELDEHQQLSGILGKSLPTGNIYIPWYGLLRVRHINFRAARLVDRPLCPWSR
jgi:hypothetical protein